MLFLNEPGKKVKAIGSVIFIIGPEFQSFGAKLVS